MFLSFNEIETKADKEMHFEVQKTHLKYGVGTRIEALKTALEEIRENLYSQIDKKFNELRLLLVFNSSFI